MPGLRSYRIGRRLWKQLKFEDDYPLFAVHTGIDCLMNIIGFAEDVTGRMRLVINSPSPLISSKSDIRSNETDLITRRNQRKEAIKG